MNLPLDFRVEQLERKVKGLDDRETSRLLSSGLIWVLFFLCILIPHTRHYLHDYAREVLQAILAP